MHFDHVAALFLFEISILADYASGSFEFLDSFIRRIDALTAFILGFVMNMFISSSMDSVLANIFTLWFSVIVDVFKSQL